MVYETDCAIKLKLRFKGFEEKTPLYATDPSPI